MLDSSHPNKSFGAKKPWMRRLEKRSLLLGLSHITTKHTWCECNTNIFLEKMCELSGRMDRIIMMTKSCWDTAFLDAWTTSSTTPSGCPPWSRSGTLSARRVGWRRWPSFCCSQVSLRCSRLIPTVLVFACLINSQTVLEVYLVNVGSSNFLQYAFPILKKIEFTGFVCQ